MTTTSYVDPRTLSATARDAARATACADPSTRVTRSLAGYGIIAGPVYVGVSLAQAVTRDGFDLGRHAWSQLAIGDWGWIQTANLVATGLMSLAFSVALRRTLAGGRGGRAVPVLVAVFGLGVLLAGVFPADPAAGFPVGMATPSTPSLHGTLHLMTSGVGFLALAVAWWSWRSGTRRSAAGAGAPSRSWPRSPCSVGSARSRPVRGPASRRSRPASSRR